MVVARNCATCMWGLGYLYAARGFAVLSYDKRGVGKSTGNWREASFEDLADDAVAASQVSAGPNGHCRKSDRLLGS